MDRNIPHLRDIFGFGSKWDTTRGHAEEKALGHDSAVSVGSTSGEEESPKNSKKKKSRRRDNSKTLTESDVKHLERHLSMKKTIRKKIMRDLQQAFVEDPNEFRVDDIPPEQLKAEINIQSLSFGTPSQKQGRTRGNAESTFLDMLRGGGKKFLRYLKSNASEILLTFSYLYISNGETFRKTVAKVLLTVSYLQILEM